MGHDINLTEFALSIIGLNIDAMEEAYISPYPRPFSAYLVDGL
jgi:hypothetical protein